MPDELGVHDRVPSERRPAPPGLGPATRRLATWRQPRLTIPAPPGSLGRATTWLPDRRELTARESKVASVKRSPMLTQGMNPIMLAQVPAHHALTSIHAVYSHFSSDPSYEAVVRRLN